MRTRTKGILLLVFALIYPTILLLRDLGGAGRPAVVEVDSDLFESDIQMGNFNGDDLTDFVGIMGEDSSPLVYLGRNGGFPNLTRVQVPGLGGTWAVGDFNGDGDDDLFVMHDSFSNPSAYVLVGDGAGDFTQQNLSDPVLLYFSQFMDTSDRLYVVDFSGDGFEDVIYFHYGECSVGISTGAWPATYTWTNYTAEPFRAHCAVDYDGDGYEDLVATDDAGSLVILRGAAGGTTNFESPVDTGYALANAWESHELHYGDFDGDGTSEIVVIPFGDLEVTLVDPTTFATRVIKYNYSKGRGLLVPQPDGTDQYFFQGYEQTVFGGFENKIFTIDAREITADFWKLVAIRTGLAFLGLVVLGVDLLAVKKSASYPAWKNRRGRDTLNGWGWISLGILMGAVTLFGYATMLKVEQLDEFIQSDLMFYGIVGGGLLAGTGLFIVPALKMIFTKEGTGGGSVPGKGPTPSAFPAPAPSPAPTPGGPQPGAPFPNYTQSPPTKPSDSWEDEGWE